ncbi:hypothetical protein BHG07_10470 [Brenneria salicis ATCC 15712 = DSM 30166]|nr:hypothetical protein BHG07_10470 [Brenneria salicis ATCC 15712 = DSM 30166]
MQIFFKAFDFRTFNFKASDFKASNFKNLAPQKQCVTTFTQRLAHQGIIGIHYAAIVGRYSQLQTACKTRCVFTRRSGGMTMVDFVIPAKRDRLRDPFS